MIDVEELLKSHHVFVTGFCRSSKSVGPKLHPTDKTAKVPLIANLRKKIKIVSILVTKDGPKKGMDKATDVMMDGLAQTAKELHLRTHI